MKPFTIHRGIAAPIDRANIDTDAIIPKQFLKSIARTGFGPQLFYDWRYLPDGKPNPEFVLNMPRYRGASILVARNNFGCGSSREHAVWAIAQYGIQVVIAPWKETHGGKIPAFADIFRNNSFKNALLTVELSEMDVEKIFQMIEKNPGLEITADVPEQRIIVHGKDEVHFHFALDASIKDRLVHGLDDIGITLKNLGALDAYEAKHHAQMKW